MRDNHPHNPVCDLYYRRFHWDFRLASYLGLLRTMSIHTMVSRLYEESALRDQTYRRLRRTRELIAALVVDGLDSPRGLEAMARIRRAHRGVAASNDEYRYVLSVFFLEPLRWNDAYGTRAFAETDRSLLFDFWMEVGRRMGIQELGGSFAEWRAFQRAFEQVHQGSSAQGQALARSALYEVVRLVIPRGMQELTRQALLGTMEPEVREVLGLRRAMVPPRVSLKLMRLASMLGAGMGVPTMDASTPVHATGREQAGR